MKLKAITSVGASVLLLGIVLAALFGFTDLDIGRGERTEVSSVAGDAPEPVITADQPQTYNVEAEVKSEVATVADIDEAIEEAAEEAPDVQRDGSTSFQVAGPFTGDVEVDFPESDPDVLVVEDPDGLGEVGVPVGFPRRSGFEIDDVRFRYDAANDEFFVGINFAFIGGDADNDGDPGSGPIDALGGGNDIPLWGTDEAFAIVLDVDNDGIGDLAAGVSDSRDINGFAVGTAFNSARFSAIDSPSDPFDEFLPELIGIAPVDTSDASPDIEFSIVQFSTQLDEELDTIGLVAFAGSFTDGGFGEEFLPARGELLSIPNPIFVPSEPEIQIEKSTNGVDADLQDDAPVLPIGSDVTFTYVVTNTGDVPLVNAVVTDDQISGDICSIASLDVGASDTCTSTQVVVEGLYRNVGTVTALENVGDDFSAIPREVSATDPSHHTGAAAGIDVEKSLNGQDLDDPNGDIPVFAIGSTITFDFEVTNTGQFPLDNIVLIDDILGTISCPVDSLAAGQQTTCQASTVVTDGQTTNTATATGQPVDEAGNPIGGPVSDDDPANHIGAASSITIEKFTNDEDADDPTGPEIATGDVVTFTYVVTNNGPSNVVDLVVTDDIEGEVCTIASLAPGASESCQLSITAGVGQYANIGSVEGQPVDEDGNDLGDPIIAEDPSHHVGVCSNFFEGPVLHQGGVTIWDTNLSVGDDSTLILTTSENGGSPGQPNEQVYIEVAGVLYGPSPAGLGTIPFDIEDGGRVRVLHISEVDTDITGANSVVPSLCGEDLTEIVPVCTDLVGGPVLHASGQLSWEPGLIAGDNSTIRVVTSENGGSPGQPNEQVYVEIGDDRYGPTPAGLGEIEFEITNGGPVTILHYSEVTGDRSSANSVIPALCGDDLSPIPGPTCPATVSGPRMIQNQTTVWGSGLTAAAGSEITIVTSDPISDVRQDHEQVYVQVGDVVYGPTPVGLGTETFAITNTGSVTILHYSEINGLQTSANSVEFEICGTGLAQTVIDHSGNND